MSEQGGTNLRIEAGDTILSATLIDSATSRDLASLLPLTLTMNDLFGREKFGRLPRPLAPGGEQTQVYGVGDIAYWSPGPDVAIFYRHDSHQIPDPGIVVVAKVTEGIEPLAVDGALPVTIALEGSA
jgi:hypothetical protein